MSLWSNILFNSVVLINCIVAFFYPFDNAVPGKTCHLLPKPNFLVKEATTNIQNRIEFPHVMAHLDYHAGISGYRHHYAS